jgi:hypothetical protein
VGFSDPPSKALKAAQEGRSTLPYGRSSASSSSPLTGSARSGIVVEHDHEDAESEYCRHYFDDVGGEQGQVRRCENGNREESYDENCQDNRNPKVLIHDSRGSIGVCDSQAQEGRSPRAVILRRTGWDSTPELPRWRRSSCIARPRPPAAYPGWRRLPRERRPAIHKASTVRALPRPLPGVCRTVPNRQSRNDGTSESRFQRHAPTASYS